MKDVAHGCGPRIKGLRKDRWLRVGKLRFTLSIRSLDYEQDNRIQQEETQWKKEAKRAAEHSPDTSSKAKKRKQENSPGIARNEIDVGGTSSASGVGETSGASGASGTNSASGANGTTGASGANGTRGASGESQVTTTMRSSTA